MAVLVMVGECVRVDSWSIFSISTAPSQCYAVVQDLAGPPRAAPTPQATQHDFTGTEGGGGVRGQDRRACRAHEECLYNQLNCHMQCTPCRCVAQGLLIASLNRLAQLHRGTPAARGGRDHGLFCLGRSWQLLFGMCERHQLPFTVCAL
jgi:hypothetical protein